MAESLYASCAEVLSICQEFKDDLEGLMHPQAGYAPRMRQICQNQIEELEDRSDSRNFTHEIDTLRLEESTWGLLQTLLPARKVEQPVGPSAKDLLLENPYTPTFTLSQAILQASPLLKELLVVREWLYDIAPKPSPPEASTGYWKFTKHTNSHIVRTGLTTRNGLMAEMDPDAVNRGDEAALAADDARYEKTLIQALYGYMRAGRLHDALEVCRRAHQPWRAASLRGSLLFKWNALSTEKYDEDTDEDDVNELDAWSGNRNRRLWKATCIRAALSPSLSDHERLLYASIVPTQETLNILKSSCRTWEDHLWAEISVLCEERTSSELERLAAGSFWEGGVQTAEKGCDELRDLQTSDEEEWEVEVVKTLRRLESVAVVEGAPASDPFHFSQLLIILNKTDRLLNIFADGIRDGSYTENTFEYNALCRFFAHFCLFLQMIEIPVPPQPTQIILESYIAVLEAAGQRDLIALYAGALGDNAVNRYAAFLVSLALSGDAAERRRALTRASEHGLDIDRVAVVAAERTIDKAFDELIPRLPGPLPSIITRQAPATDVEKLLLRSIEWTTAFESTYHVALEHAAVILRYLLGAGRVQVAHTLLDMLPADIAAIEEPEEIATEYLHYRQFFTIWDTIERVVACQAQEGTAMQGPAATRDARAAWVAEYRGLIDQVHDQIMKLLTTEWLVADVENGGGDRRRRDLIRIRQIFVPELILRLHHLLYSSRKLISENLKRALELANVVADARYKLYEDFMGEGGRSLAEYLGLVRQAVLAGLENGGSDPFRVVSS